MSYLIKSALLALGAGLAMGEETDYTLEDFNTKMFWRRP